MGAALALATAVSFAVSNVLIRVAARQVSGDRLVVPSPAFQAEVMRRTTVVNVGLLWPAWVVAMLADGLLWDRPSALPASGPGVLAFAAAGVAGPFLARVVLYRGLAHLGPGRLAAGKALAPAMAAVLAAAVLGEPVGAGLGAAIVLIGIGTVLTVGGLGGRVRVDLQGFLYGAHSAWWLAVAALFRRMGVLALLDVLFGAALGSTVSLILVTVMARSRHRAASVPEGLPEPLRRSLLASGLLSTTALICSIAALAHAPVGPVMAIHHTEPALAQWLGHLALGGTDRARLTAALGTLMVIVGALMV